MVSALRPDTQGARIGMLFLSYASRQHRSHCNISFHLGAHNYTRDGRISRLHSWRSFLTEHAPLFEQKLACRAGFIALHTFGSSFRSSLAHLQQHCIQRRQQSVRFCSPLDCPTAELYGPASPSYCTKRSSNVLAELADCAHPSLGFGEQKCTAYLFNKRIFFRADAMSWRTSTVCISCASASRHRTGSFGPLDRRRKLPSRCDGSH